MKYELYVELENQTDIDKLPFNKGDYWQESDGSVWIDYLREEEELIQVCISLEKAGFRHYGEGSNDAWANNELRKKVKKRIEGRK